MNGGVGAGIYCAATTASWRLRMANREDRTSRSSSAGPHGRPHARLVASS